MFCFVMVRIVFSQTAATTHRWHRLAEANAAGIGRRRMQRRSSPPDSYHCLATTCGKKPVSAQPCCGRLNPLGHGSRARKKPVVEPHPAPTAGDPCSAAEHAAEHCATRHKALGTEALFLQTVGLGGLGLGTHFQKKRGGVDPGFVCRLSGWGGGRQVGRQAPFGTGETEREPGRGTGGRRSAGLWSGRHFA